MKHRILTTPEDLQRFKKLHNVLFSNTDMSKEWMHWYLCAGEFFSAPLSTTRVHGLFDGDMLVGVWCVEPKKFSTSSGTSMNVGRCFSVGIHPDYRRQNLFVELSTKAIEAEKSIGEYEYVLGFPQVGRPVIAAHMKSGWEKVQDIQIYSQNPQVRGSETEESLSSLISVRDFKRVVRGCSTYQNQFHETNEYKNYRWLKHPDNHYICLSDGGSDDRGEGYVVLKQYADVYHVVDLGGPEGSVLTLLNAARTLARRHGCKEINIWCADNEQYKNVIELSGFCPGAQHAASVELLAVRIKASVPLKLDKCHFSMGSEEVY